VEKKRTVCKKGIKHTEQSKEATMDITGKTKAFKK